MDLKAITSNGRAAFYAAIWEDLRKSAMDCGWALALHGSLASDLDIMAMPWTEKATEPLTMIHGLLKTLGFSQYWIDNQISIDRTSKPNGRVVYTIPIFGDYYIDLNTIENNV